MATYLYVAVAGIGSGGGAQAAAAEDPGAATEGLTSWEEGAGGSCGLVLPEPPLDPLLRLFLD